MGLKVWFPLLGDLNLQGCSNILATNLGGVSSNNNGKIGKCMSFNGSSTGALQLPPILTAGQSFSICFWVKFNNLSVNHCLFSLRIAVNDLGFTIFWIAGLTGIRFDAGGAISGGYTRITDTSTWHHVVCCRNLSKKYIYIDGELIREDDYTSVSSSNVNSNYAIIGGSLNSSDGSTSDANYLNGYLNDYRIYDHCLSAAEVREISLGLVLHYKLDASGNKFANPNLLTGNVNDASIWTANQCTKTLDGSAIKVVINSTTGDRRIYLGTTNVWTPINSTFTVSFDAKAEIINLPIRVSRSNVTGTDSVSFALTTEWKHYSGIIVNSAEATGGTLSIQCTIDGGTFWVRNVKLERGNIETRFLLSTENANIISDSSGYNHNGTITGNITLNSNTPRHSASSLFNGTERVTTTTPGADIRTLSCWCKTTKNKSTSLHMVADSFSNMCISFYKGTIIGVFGTTRSTGSKCTLGDSYKENDWNHIVVVKTDDAGARDIYCNGVKLTPTSNDYWGAATGFFVGARNTSNGNPFYGLISDVRAYCTALDADAIRQLYLVGAKVDNEKNIHAYEFIEKSDGNEFHSATSLYSILINNVTPTTSSTSTISYRTAVSPAPNYSTKYISKTRYQYSYDTVFDLSSPGIYTLHWPQLSGKTYTGSYTASSWIRQNGRYTSLSTTRYYNYGLILILLICYDENDTTISTITLSSESLSLTKTGTSYVASTLILNSGSIKIEVPETNLGAYAKLIIRFTTSSQTLSSSHFFITKAPPLNYITPQIKKTGVFINRNLNEISSTEDAFIEKHGKLVCDQFIEN